MYKVHSDYTPCQQKQLFLSLLVLLIYCHSMDTELLFIIKKKKMVHQPKTFFSYLLWFWSISLSVPKPLSTSPYLSLHFPTVKAYFSRKESYGKDEEYCSAPLCPLALLSNTGILSATLAEILQKTHSFLYNVHSGHSNNNQ